MLLGQRCAWTEQDSNIIIGNHRENGNELIKPIKIKGSKHYGISENKAMYYLKKKNFNLRIKLSKRTKAGKKFKELIDAGKSYKDLKLYILDIALKHIDIYTFMEKYNENKEKLIELGKSEKLREIGDAFQIESLLKKIA